MACSVLVRPGKLPAIVGGSPLPSGVLCVRSPGQWARFSFGAGSEGFVLGTRPGTVCCVLVTLPAKSPASARIVIGTERASGNQVASRADVVAPTTGKSTATGTQGPSGPT